MEKTLPENGSLNYNTILQLGLYCCNMEKWISVPYGPGILWWSSGQDSKLSLLRGHIWSLVGKLKSHRSLWQTKREKKGFMVLYQNPTLSCSCNQKPRESVNTSDVLDDPLPAFPSSQVRKTKPRLLPRTTYFSGACWLPPNFASLCSFISSFTSGGRD